MAIKDLRIMRRGVDVTVVVGSNKYGGDVTCKVNFSRDQLAEVLAPLEALALEEAMAVLSTSVVQKDVDERVRLEVEAGVASTKERLAKNNRSTVEQLLKSIEKDLVTEKQRFMLGDVEKVIETVPSWNLARIKKTIETARASVQQRVAS